MAQPQRDTGFRYVALGDSTSEGIGDIPLADGTPRGWADRLAEILAVVHGRVEYANLAVRGLKAGQVLESQLEPARALKPDLVTISAGVNDLLRPDFTVERLRESLTALVSPLVADGATVVLVPAPPVAHLMPLGRLTDPVSHRIEAMNGVLTELAREPGVVVPENLTAELFGDPRMWAPDRLHLNDVGHDRLARGVALVLGGAEDPGWDVLPTGPAPRRTLIGDARWWIGHGTPWVIRRLRGRSSSDGRSAKRPSLEPVVATEATV